MLDTTNKSNTASSDSPLSPLIHKRIYDDLAGKITRGEIAYLEQLPVLPELCGIYDASHVTVRRALESLERDGFIRRQRGRGKGTFAIRRSSKATIRLLFVGEAEVLRSPVELCHEIFDLMAGIREAAALQNASVHTVSPTSFDSISASDADKRAVGYIILAMDWAGYCEGVQMAMRHGAPYVLVNPPLPGYPSVRVDMEEAAFLAVQHLAQLGHQRIAYVGSNGGEWFAPRWDGYRRALASHGLDFDPALFHDSDGATSQQDEQALESLLALSSPPTAVFAASDYRALHLLNHCRRLGIQVPDDLSLCGYDNIGETADVNPALTTVHHPRLEQGKEAVSLLLDLMNEGRSDVLDRQIRPHIVVRESCAPLKTRSLIVP
ncbi:MAG: substrate-binding domain-containing protein [Armatimonadota bacterium]